MVQIKSFLCAMSNLRLGHIWFVRLHMQVFVVYYLNSQSL